MKLFYSFIFLLAIANLAIYTMIFTRPPQKMVLGSTTKQIVQVQPSPTPLPTLDPTPIQSGPTTTPSPTITPTPQIVLKKSSYTIAIIGDSMVDTMGENLEYLQADLKEKYPKTVFHLYNYGIGAQNVSKGLARFDSPFDYKTRKYPPISQLSADIIIAGSFAYNPFDPHDRNKHWTELTTLVEKAKASAKKVYILAEIAPLKSGFGDGPNGVNWPADQSYQQVLHIIEQLENAQNLAKDLHVTLIDAFSASQTQGKFGNPAYVGSNDGIHPSEAGHVFMANLIANRLKLQ